ncbi:MAG: Do family serine endopeptidase, partial [Rhodospirillales bacterium]
MGIRPDTGNVTIKPLLLGFLMAAFAFLPAAAQTLDQSILPESREEMTLTFAPLVRKAAPAVVNILTTKQVRQRQVSPLFDDPFFRRFFGDRFGTAPNGQSPKTRNSLGSGVIVNPDGMIVTNVHVIEGADSVTVVLHDRRELPADIIGTDERTDLAFLKVDNGGEPLPHLAFRDSDDLEVGDLVLAIGNPFGVGQTVTSGIVSAQSRTEVGVTELGSFIQTDAAINPGNSGGALITMDGKLVGVNTAIYSKSGGSHGIGFAIPSNLVKAVMKGLTKEGKVVRPWLGAWGQPVTQEMAMALGLQRPGGVLINMVYPGGPAAKADLRVGDVVLAVNGKEVDDPRALSYRIATLGPGGTVPLSIRRTSGLKDLALHLEVPSTEPEANRVLVGGRNPLSGAEVANMSPALGEE